MQAIGDCLVPLVTNGADLVFSQTARPGPGDLVAVYFRPELARPGGVTAVVKRLAFGVCTENLYPDVVMVKSTKYRV
jgi:hypothetical protein